MAEPFLGEIVMFGGNFAPRGWAFCDGQLLPISQNQALFSILGTIYGGDGRTTFALPELRGRVAMHAGNGPGLTPRPLGQKSGAETNYLNQTQLPAHNHAAVAQNGAVVVRVADQVGAISAAHKGVLGKNALETNTSNAVEVYVDENTATFNNNYDLGGIAVQNPTVQVGMTGNNQGVNNIQPYQCVNYIIALTGVFPSRN